MKYMLCILALVLAGCTENQRARSLGGSMTIELPQNTKLVNATWKQDDLWYLMRPMQAGEKAETLLFKESSSFGLLQGTVTFKESLTSR